jgi:hypothetical protein
VLAPEAPRVLAPHDQRWRGCFGGRQHVGRGPAAPVWKGEERFSSNSGNGEARRALTGEGEDSGGARKNPMQGRGLRWLKVAVQAWERWGGRWCSRGGQSRVGDKGVDEWLDHVQTARSTARQRGEKEGRGGVRCMGATRHGGDRGASPRQAGGAPTMSRTRRAQAARCCSDSGALALTWKGPSGSESQEGAERHKRTWPGTRRKRGGRAQMNSNI